MAHAAADHPLVELRSAAQPDVDAAEEAVFPLARIGTQDQGAEGRREGQGHERRDQHRHGDRDGELAVELAGDARKEAHGNEHGAQHQRCGDDGAAQSAHGLFRGFVGR